MAPCRFLTNHGLTLLCIVHDPGARMRDIAAEVQITERATQRIVADLIEAGYLDRVLLLEDPSAAARERVSRS